MADPLKQFEIKPLVPLELGGLDLSFTNSSLWMAIAVVLSVSLFGYGISKRSLVPGRLQMFTEVFYEFVSGMIRDTMGEKGKQYFPIIFTVFVVVLMGNLLGMVPSSFTYTSHIIVTGALALLVFLLVTFIGIWRHGFAFFGLFCPPGLPFLMKFLIVPIEMLSFFVRPVTLSVRLFANMMAGHLVLKVFAGFSVSLLMAVPFVGPIASLVPMGFNILMIAFEFLVALLQAYVFAILSAIYLNDTIEIHH